MNPKRSWQAATIRLSLTNNLAVVMVRDKDVFLEIEPEELATNESLPSWLTYQAGRLHGYREAQEKVCDCCKHKLDFGETIAAPKEDAA